MGRKQRVSVKACVRHTRCLSPDVHVCSTYMAVCQHHVCMCQFTEVLSSKHDLYQNTPIQPINMVRALIMWVCSHQCEKHDYQQLHPHKLCGIHICSRAHSLLVLLLSVALCLSLSKSKKSGREKEEKKMIVQAVAEEEDKKDKKRRRSKEVRLDHLLPHLDAGLT